MFNENPEPRVRSVNSDDIQSVVKWSIAGFRQEVADLKTMYTNTITQGKESQFSTITAGSDGSECSVSYDASSS